MAQKPAVIIWLRGYALTPEEEREGFLGNYALVTVKAVQEEKEKFTLIATKLAADLKHHPQTKRPKQQHPDWGHPILRGVKRKKLYLDVEHAQAELQALHEEYPDVTIPCTHKLYIIIYDKKLNKVPPVQKWVLTVQPQQDGGYYIVAEENNYQAAPALPGQQAREAQEPVGFFTAKIAMKGKKG